MKNNANILIFLEIFKEIKLTQLCWSTINSKHNSLENAWKKEK